MYVVYIVQEPIPKNTFIRYNGEFGGRIIKGDIKIENLFFSDVQWSFDTHIDSVDDYRWNNNNNYESYNGKKVIRFTENKIWIVGNTYQSIDGEFVQWDNSIILNKILEKWKYNERQVEYRNNIISDDSSGDENEDEDDSDYNINADLQGKKNKKGSKKKKSTKKSDSSKKKKKSDSSKKGNKK